MKKLFLLLALLGFVFTACEGGLNNEENGNAESAQIALSRQFVNVNSDEAEYSVEVTSSCSWQAVSLNDWIEVGTRSGIAGTKDLLFSVETNYDSKKREGTIVISNTSYNITTELYVIQEAFSPKITIAPESLKFSYEGGTQSVEITANCNYSYTSNVDWITIEQSANVIIVAVSMLNTTANRAGQIVISNERYNVSKIIDVLQNGIPESESRVIYYTASNNRIITPANTDAFGANIISNTYENGQGVIIFDAPVTSIGDNAFSECGDYLTSITIPKSITRIGEKAFYWCLNLANITIPNGVISIGKEAFSHCRSFTSINIPDGVTLIDSKTFYDCTSLVSVTIPQSVTVIGEYAFDGCISLTSVIIPDSVIEIGAHAFLGCDNLTSITIPQSVTLIGTGAFTGCTGELIINSKIIEKDYSSSGYPNHQDYQNDYAWLYKCQFTKLVIGDNIKKIGDYVFYKCDSLTSVTIPNSVTSIGTYAFRDCSSLTSVTIPEKVTSIGNFAFTGCLNLKEIYCKPPTPPTLGYYYTFSDNAASRKIYVPHNSVSTYKAASLWSDYASSIVGYDF